MKILRTATFCFAATLMLASCSPPKPAMPAGGGSLAEAWQIISQKTFVDLTHTFSPTTPVWPGFGAAKLAPVQDPTGQPYTVEKDGWRAFQYTLVGQYGTHIDPDR